MTHAKFNFNQLMLTLIFGIQASEPPLGPGERLKRLGLIGLKRANQNRQCNKVHIKIVYNIVQNNGLAVHLVRVFTRVTVALRTVPLLQKDF